MTRRPALPHVKWLRLLVAITAVALSITAANADLPQQANADNFQIDGDQHQDAVAGTYTAADDWQNVAVGGAGASGGGVSAAYSGPGVISDEIYSGAGNTDNSVFGGGSKFLQPSTWSIISKNGGPAQNDLANVSLALKFLSPSQPILFFGYERLTSPGNFFLDLEINRLAPLPSGLPQRSNGDVVVSTNIASNPSTGKEISIDCIRFTDASVEPNLYAQCTGVPVGGFNMVGTNLQTQYDTTGIVAFMNPSATTGGSFNHFYTDGNRNYNTGRQIAAFRFVEGAVDLAQIGIAPSCPGFGWVHFKTKTSSSSTQAELVDLTLPVQIDLSTCGKLIIQKFQDNGTTPLAGATFTISPNPIPGSPDSPALTVVDGGLNDPDGTANGVITFDPAKPVLYTITETSAPGGWFVDATNPRTVTVPPKGTGTVSFSNRLGQIRLSKTYAGGTPVGTLATFGFFTDNTATTPKNVKSCIPGAASVTSVTDNGANDANPAAGTIDVTRVCAGTYWVKETSAPAGYFGSSAVQQVVVNAPAPTWSSPASAFANLLGQIRLTKTYAGGTPVGTLATFGFFTDSGATTPANLKSCITGATAVSSVTDNGANDANPAAGTIDVTNVCAGTYWVKETSAPAGYVGDSGVLQVVVSAAAPTWSSPSRAFANVLGSIRIEKRDSVTNALLPGSAFTFNVSPFACYGGAQTVFADGGSGDAANGNDGVILITNVCLGSYTVDETTTPAGYTAGPQQTFSVTGTTLVVRVFLNTPAGQGCTPGYWKTHLAAWGPTGFSPGQSVISVFTAQGAWPGSYAAYLSTSTLLQALDFQGGPDLNGAAETLLRTGVAALLNAAHPNVSYPLTTSQVISQVKAALASANRTTILNLASTLNGYNNLGCPLN